MKALFLILALAASARAEVVALAPVNGITAYSATSSTATTVNLTSSAGTKSNIVVCLSSNGGAAAGFKVTFTRSATAPVGLTSTGQGHYIAASTTAQCWGPFTPGTIMHIAGVAATSSVLVALQPIQAVQP